MDRITERLSESKKPRELDWGEWFVILVLIVVGLSITGRGAAARDFVGTLFGLAVTVAPILGTPQLRFYIKLTINYVSRGKFFHVVQSNVQAENIINIQGDSASVQIGTADYTARELVESVYSPLLTEAKSWSNPMTMNCRMWKELQEKVPHLTRLVKTDIADMFSRAERVSRRITALNFSLQELERKACLEARQKLAITPSHPGQGSVSFRVFKTNLPSPLWTIYINWLLVTGKRLVPYVQDFVDEKYTGIEWDLDLQIDGYTVGDRSKAIQFADEVFAFYEKQPVARQLRVKYDEMTDLGVKAQFRINEEFDKLLRVKA